MLSDRNLFPRANELRRFGVPPHTPLRTLTEGSVIRALVGYDDERHLRVRSISEAEFVAAPYRANRLQSIRTDTPVRGRWGDARAPGPGRRHRG